MDHTDDRILSNADLLELQRWNTPAVYNGWEQITESDAGRDGFNIEECRDFMPQMGPMAGYAMTVVVEPSNVEHRRKNPNAWSEYRRYVGSVPGPKIVVVQDLDKPRVFGSFWGDYRAKASGYRCSMRQVQGKQKSEVRSDAVRRFSRTAYRVPYLTHDAIRNTHDDLCSPQDGQAITSTLKTESRMGNPFDFAQAKLVAHFNNL